MLSTRKNYCLYFNNFNSKLALLKQTAKLTPKLSFS